MLNSLVPTQAPGVVMGWSLKVLLHAYRLALGE